MKRSIGCVAGILLLAVTQMALGDLVGHWKLDDGVGTTALDSSGMGNNGTFKGETTPTWIDGVIGGALEFNDGAYVDCGAGDSLDITGATSMALWIRPDAEDPESKGTETAPMAKAMSGMSPSWSYQVRYGWGSGTPYMAFTFNTSPRAWAYLNQNLTRYEWCHIACSYDGTTLKSYLNGVQAGTTAMGAITSSDCPVLIGSDGWRSDWIGAIDDVRIYNNALTDAEILEVMAGGDVELAKDPSPEDGETDVLCSTSLSWTAGEYAATHDVYFGTSFDDVNDATRDDSRDVLISKDQDAAEYQPQEALEFGQTYYWRVDEVNAAPDSTIFKGQTWSFTVEPYAYPVTPVAATASSAGAGMGPGKTIDGSGLEDDQHSTALNDMWLTPANALPAWIQYEFDQEYKLYELWVWNSNYSLESALGYGAKDVTIEYSSDGQTWTALESPVQFAQAPGVDPCPVSCVVSLGEIVAKYVKLTITTNWGGFMTQTGLSEVRFFYVPLVARDPQPADGETDVAADTSLQWRPGREAVSHKVYLGTDSSAVAEGTAAAVTATDRTYTPDDLDVATTYYWRVDEVGESTTYAGEVWSFSTEDFVTIEDFESYNDDDNRLYETWVDGVTNGSGSYVGYETASNGTFGETLVVHDGRQALPLFYNNAKSPYYSETECTFGSAQNWTAHGADTLTLYFQGAEANSSQPVYVTVKDSSKSATITYSNTAASLITEWQQWNIPLSDITSAGVKVTAVRALVIGVGNKSAPSSGGTGVVYFDDIGYGRSSQ